MEGGSQAMSLIAARKNLELIERNEKLQAEVAKLTDDLKSEIKHHGRLARELEELRWVIRRDR